MDRRNSDYRSRNSGSNDGANRGRSSFSHSYGQASSSYHPYSQRNDIQTSNNGYFDARRSSGYGDERFGNDRRSYGGHNNCDRGYNDHGGSYNSRGGYGNDRRSNDGYSNRGGSYNSRGGFGNDRGRGNGFSRGRGRGGPGLRKAPGDDSKTEPLRAAETIPFSELHRYPLIFKSEIPAVVNGYEITTKKAKAVYQYDIQWKGITKKGKEMNMNIQTKAGHKLQLKQVALFTVFDQLLRENKKFFGFNENGSKFVFDTGSIFFAHEKLLDKNEPPRQLKIEVAEFSQEAKNYYKDIQSAFAVISLAREIDLNALNGDLGNDRPILQYLELAFSQDQRKRGDYYCFDNDFFEKKSVEEIGRTPFVLKNGCRRSIRLIGDPDDKKLLIHVVPRKTAFYGTTSLTELIEHTIGAKIGDIWHGENFKKANKAVNHLTVCTTHMESNRTFVSSGLSKIPADRLTFERNGEEITVDQYYLDAYKIRLRRPDLPCLIQAGGNCYPLEVLEISEVQKVPKPKQDRFLTSMITNKCSIFPFQHVEAIEKQREDAEILNSNDYIKNTGCHVDARRLLPVPARQLYPPCIVFKDAQKTLNSGLFGMQTGDRFAKPAIVEKFACVLASHLVSRSEAGRFFEELIKRLKLYGIQINEHEIFVWSNGGRDCPRLLDLERDGFDYVLAIGDDDELHHGLKLMELQTRLVTQHVMTNTVQKANNTSYDNLAFKFNLRAGGVNWTLASDPALIERYPGVDLLKSLAHDTMFFGIDLSHNSDEPTCVGFASNLFSTSTCMSKGDFGYQSPQKTLVDPMLLASKFTDALQAYYLKNGKYPLWIVVYRAGLSEGEIHKIQQEEIPVLKTAIKKLQSMNSEFNKIDVKLTFVMSNEETNYRLFKKEINKDDKAPAQNLPCGSCVSEVIVVRNRIPSFILISQRALKGTARPTCYYVLEGNDVVPFDHLQWLTYCLCYSNTPNAPTRMPGPLESAADLSKRARNNLKYWKIQKKHDGEDVGDENIDWSKKGDKTSGNEDEYLDVLNQELRAPINGGRFWA